MNCAELQKSDFNWAGFIGKPYHKYLKEKKYMAHNKFTLEEAVERLNLKTVSVKSIVEDFEPHTPSDFLQTALRRGTALALRSSTEKARSEMIVTPILLELQEVEMGKISLFSGIDFKVDPKRGLSGRCDFIISADGKSEFMTAPAITIVEAKNDNVRGGLGQCIAEMVAAQLFNQRHEKDIPTIYGVVTTGINWRFLKLEGNTVFIENTERTYDFERNLNELLGLLIRLTETQN